jgi:hypothetical protein
MQIDGFLRKNARPPTARYPSQAPRRARMLNFAVPAEIISSKINARNNSRGETRRAR